MPPGRHLGPVSLLGVLLIVTSIGVTAIEAEGPMEEPTRPEGDPTPSSLLAAAVDASLADAVVGPQVPAAIAPAAASYDLEARYDVDLFLDWGTRRIRVDTAISLLNTSGGSVDRLHLNTIAAKLGSLTGLRVHVDGERVAASIAGQTIKVRFDEPLASGASAAVTVFYRARLRTSIGGRGFLFAKHGGVAHLYRFIPWLSRKIAFGSTPHGEPFLTPSSPEVRVEVDSDRKLKWATSGRRIAKSGKRRTFLANDVRDFNIAVSPGYRKVSGTSKDGDTKIIAFTRVANGRRLVNLARTELARYAAKTGIPYPHPTYTVAESGGGLAMESPALIWIPRTRAAFDHPFLVSHETAHQWFYGIVGNDQATDAFADEAIADYYSRKAHLSLRPSRCKQARLDLGIRRYSSSCYFEVIYVQGARFLDSLRRDFGKRKFRKAIRDYAHDHRDGIGSNRKLLEAVRGRMGDKVVKRFKRRFPSLY